MSTVDKKTILLLEVDVEKEIEQETWTQYESTSVYSTDYEEYVIAVKCNGVVFIEVYTINECSNIDNSFYYDETTQKLYVHLATGDPPDKQTSPPAYNYILLAREKRCFSSENYIDNRIVYPRQEDAIYNGGFEIWYPSLLGWTETETGSSTVEKESSTKNSGAYCAKLSIDESNSSATLSRNLRIPPSAVCKLELYHMQSGSATAKVVIRDSGSNVYLKSDATWSASSQVIALEHQDTWTKYELQFTAHSSYENYIIELTNNSAASQSCYFDDVSLIVNREDRYYWPTILPSSAAELLQKIALFHEQAIIMEFGSIQLGNEGSWWYSQIKDYLWAGKHAVIKVKIDNNSPVILFEGLTRSPRITDSIATVEVVDYKAFTYVSIPQTYFTVEEYTYLEDGADGRPIPIIYGKFEEVAPVMCNFDNYVFKVASHPVEEISNVKRNGEELTEGVDYEVDLENATITMTANPYQAFVVCSVKGKQCNFENGNYSQNVADILYDLLVNYGGIDPTDIDIESFLNLKAHRTQYHHLYIDSTIPLLEILRKLQSSALFQLVITEQGKIKVLLFREQDESALVLTEEDVAGIQFEKTLDGVYDTIAVSYNFLPSEGLYDIAVLQNPDVVYKYGTLATLEIETSLRQKEDALDLLNYYIGRTGSAWETVSLQATLTALTLSPGKKITLDVETADSEKIFNMKPIRILEVRKDFFTGLVKLVGVDDLQAAGGNICEVCYACQVCVTMETGTCATCYTCQDCDAGQCSSCQTCYYCQVCVTAECSTCQLCDTCQECNTCQMCNTGQCSFCLTCQECNLCQACNKCQLCVTIQGAQ